MPPSATITNAATGETLRYNSFLFSSLDELQKYLFQEWGIPAERQLILLPFGNKLTRDSFFSILALEHSRGETDNDGGVSTIGEKLYVYDRKLFSLISEPFTLSRSQVLELEKLVSEEPVQSSVLGTDVKAPPFDEASLSEALHFLETLSKDERAPPSPSLIRPSTSPLLEVDLSNPLFLTYEKIKSVLTTNLGWLSALDLDVRYFNSFVDGVVEEILRILECLEVCYQYLRTYSYELDTLHTSNVSYSGQLRKVATQLNRGLHPETLLENIHGLNDLSLNRYIDAKTLHKKATLLTELESGITKDLIEVEKSIRENSQMEGTILSSIDNIKTYFDSCRIEAEPEKPMLTKFEELSARLKANCEEILNADNLPVDNTTIGVLREDKNETVRTLYTIALALYVKAEKFSKIKKNIQLLTILTMGQIAYSQMMCAKVKNFLLNGWNEKLSQYQKFVDEIASISDLPLIYGYYLIERYRRCSWCLQRSLTVQKFYEDNEKIIVMEQFEREKWIKTLPNMPFSFLSEMDDDVDMNFGNRIPKSVSVEQLSLELEELTVSIRHYTNELEKNGVDKSLIDRLNKKFREVSQVKPLFTQSNLKSKQDVENMELEYNKARANSLELLLHETILSNSHHWPVGIFADSQAGKNDTSLVHAPSIVDNIVQNNLVEDTYLSGLDKTYFEFQMEITQLQDQIQGLQKIPKERDLTISQQKTKISDLSLENVSYRETLDSLREELRKMTTQEQKLKLDTLEKTENYKISTRTLIEQNMKNSKKLDDITTERNKLLESTAVLESEKEELKEQIFNLTKKIHESEIVIKREPRDEAVQTEDIQPTNIVPPGSVIRTHSTEKNDSFEFLGALQQWLFNIIGGNIRILENIGLLLVSNTEKTNTEQKFSIKRVKGLSKGTNNHRLGDSTTLGDVNLEENSIASPVFYQFKNIFDKLGKNKGDNDVALFLSYVDNLYSRQLYENSVISRFKDVEMLAKNLTKENKLLKKFNRDESARKLNLNNFRIGDLALFLPIKHAGEATDSGPPLSADSHFSSVDLSTSPLLPPTRDQHRYSTNLWAAFTAFDDKKKYLLRADDEDSLSTRDWFVGKITSLEEYHDSGKSSGVVTTDLVSSVTWYYVAATIVESV